MTKEMQAALTVGKIVENATALFNQHGYGGASIGDIATKASLSKGILYHYFKNKDTLYLHCCQRCIDTFDQYLEDHFPKEPMEDIGDSVELTWDFFGAYPQYEMLFYHILARKPVHLGAELDMVRRDFREKNLVRFSTLVKGLPLGKGVTCEDAQRFLALFQQMTPAILSGVTSQEDVVVQREQMVRLMTIFINGLSQDL